MTDYVDLMREIASQKLLSVQDFTVAAGKFCNVLKINVWMVYLDILI